MAALDVVDIETIELDVVVVRTGMYLERFLAGIKRKIHLLKREQGVRNNFEYTT
jgi:hypothetical protein